MCCRDEGANHQLPIAGAFWIIQIVSTEECSSVMQNLMQICCSTHSVILNVTATQYTRSLSGVYRPHWLVLWSHRCSCTCTPVHSPCLPSYIDVPQTILVILTVAKLFPHRPRILKNETAGSYSNSIFNFWDTSVLFSIVAAPIYIPTNSASVPFYHILANTQILSFWCLPF